MTLFAILLPIVLMLAATAAALIWPAGSTLRTAAEFIGSPIVAMVVAVLVAFYVFGIACGRDRSELLRFSEECLAPGRVAAARRRGRRRLWPRARRGRRRQRHPRRGVGLRLSPLLLGWVIAALLRIAVGSATVAIMTAAGIMAPVAAAEPGTNVELLVVALGAGSIVASHVNDGGFWLVKEYFGLSVVQTLATWTVIETGVLRRRARASC